MKSIRRPPNKCYLVKVPVCSSYEATVVSEPSSAPRSTPACSSVPPYAPLPARHSSGFVKAEKMKPTVCFKMAVSCQCVTLLTICVRWCSLSKRFLPVATSSSNSLNFSSICLSNSAASGFRPSFPRRKAVSEKMHDLVSSVHELLRGVGVGGRVEDKKQVCE